MGLLRLLVWVWIVAGQVPMAHAAEPPSSEIREFIAAGFQKGKNFYDHGQYREALAAWDSLSPYLAEDPSVRDTIDFLKRKIREKEMQGLIRQADQKFQAEFEETRARKAATESAADHQRKEVEAAYERGRALYFEGRYDEALNIWKALVPYFEDGAAVESGLKALERDYAELRRLQAVPRASPSPVSSRVSSEISQLLSARKKELKTELLEAERRSMKLTPVDEQHLRAVFERGKKLYDAGHFQEALATWEVIVPAVEDAPRLEALMDEIRQSSARIAKQSEEEWRKGADPSRPKNLPQLSKILQEASDRLRKEAIDAQSRTRSLKKGAVENEAEVMSIFEKGKRLYEQSRYEEAADEWERLEFYMDERAGIRERVQAFRENARNVEKARLASQGPVRPSVSSVSVAEMAKVLDQAGRRFQAEEAEARALKKTSEKPLALAQEGFQKGKLAFFQGRYEEAIRQWDVIAPHLDAATRAQLDTLKQNYARMVAARSADDSVPPKAGGLEPAKAFQSPDELKRLLEQGSQKLRLEAEEARALSAASAPPQANVDEAFRKGKLAYFQGRYDEAIREWDAVMPEVDASTRAQFEALKENHTRMVAARSADDSVPPKAGGLEPEQKFQSPDELKRLLEQASQKLKIETREAEANRLKADQALGDRSAAIEAAFREGKILYAQGRTREALAAWNAMLPFIDDAEDIKRRMLEVEQNEVALQGTEEALRLSATEHNVRLKAPEELTPILDETAKKLKEQTGLFDEQRQSSTGEADQARQAMLTVFQKGKMQYDRGDFGGALSTWELLLHDLEDAPRLRSVMMEVRKAYDDRQRAKAAADEAAIQAGGSTASSKALMGLLGEASKKLEEEEREAIARVAALRLDSQTRQYTSVAHFDDGRKLYEKGRMEEAFKEWEFVAENDPALKAALARARQSHQNAVKAKQEAEMLSKRPAVIKVPADELRKILAQAEQKWKLDIQEAEARKKKIQATLLDRQAEIDDRFKKGKRLYAEGKIDEALSEWEKLVAFADGASLKEPLGLARKNQAEALKARRETDALMAKHAQAAKVPVGEVEALLEEAGKQFTAQAKEASARKTAAQGKARQAAWIDETFEKGKALYKEGKTEAAIREWEKLVALADQPSAKEKLERLKKSYEDSIKAQAEIRALPQAPDAKVPVKDLEALLNQAAEKLEADAQAAMSQKTAAEDTAAKRKAWVDRTVASGKALYDEGKFEEALAAWKSVLPFLEDEAKIRPSIEAFEQNWRRLAEARQKSAPAKVPSPAKRVSGSGESLSKLLNEADGKIQSDLDKMASQKAGTEEAASDRQVWVTFTFQEGKERYEQGNIDSALAKWETLIPYLEEEAKKDASVKELLKKTRELLEKAGAAQRQAREALARQDKKFKAPSDLKKLLADANKKFTAQEQEALKEKTRTESALAQREAWIDSTFRDGQKLYDQGKYEEALAVWKPLTAYVENGGTLKESMQTLSRLIADAKQKAKAKKK